MFCKIKENYEMRNKNKTGPQNGNCFPEKKIRQKNPNSTEMLL